MTNTEAALAEIWSEILNVDLVSPDDDFFEVGGDSLGVLQMLRSIGDRWGVHVPLPVLFETRRLSLLAREIDRRVGGGDADAQLIRY